MGFYYVYDEDGTMIRRFDNDIDAIAYAESLKVPCYVQDSYTETIIWSSL